MTEQVNMSGDGYVGELLELQQGCEGPFGSSRCYHKPFSLLELGQIKQDLGSYTDDLGKSIDMFQHITLAFDLTWKDIMVIFS